MIHLKIYENYNENNIDYKQLSKIKPDYKEGDYVKFIGPYKKGLSINSIYIVDKITYEYISVDAPDYYYFTRLKDNRFNLFSAKLRKLTELELNEMKYNL